MYTMRSTRCAAGCGINTQVVEWVGACLFLCLSSFHLKHTRTHTHTQFVPSSMPHSRTGVVGANPSMTSSEFNSWVIGGQYAKSNLKRHHLRDAGVSSSADGGENAVEPRRQIEERREELRRQLDAHQLVYNSKVAEALRTPSSRAARLGSETTSSRKDSPKRQGTPPKPNQAEGADTNAADNTSAALRGRLKASFAKITATHAYGTLFPPLLTPFNRGCLLGASSSSQSPGGSPRTAGDTTIPDKDATSPKKHVVRNDLSVVAGERRRVQPVSGPKAFFPTGSCTSVYRHFVHVPTTDRGTFSTAK